MRAIFTFHSIDDSGSVLSYPIASFERLIAALKANDIPIVDMKTLLSSNDKGVSLTFDDGMHSVHQHALPILQRHQATAHVFVATQYIGTDKKWPESDINPSFDMLNWQQVEELHDAGWRIDAHTKTHPDLRQLTIDQVAKECNEADAEIEQRLGRRPQYFAYPFGYHNGAVREFIGNSYLAAVTTELAYLENQNEAVTLPRLDSYYLRSSWAINNIDSVMMKTYLGVRCWMRNIRRSQCVADSD